MKIAIDIRMLSDKAHGISRYIKNLLSQFFTLSKEHEFFLLRGEDLDFLDKKRYIFKKLRAKKFSLQEQIEVPRILNGILPDVFHAPSIAAPLLQRFPTVITIHDLIPFIFPKYYPRHSLLYLPVLKAVAKKAGLILVPSESTQEDVVKILKISPEKIRITPEGPEKIFNPRAAEAEKEAVQRNFKLTENFFLTVVNPRPHKNFAELLKAFSALKEKNITLTVVGQVSDKDLKLTTRAGLEKRVFFLGDVPDNVLAVLYQTALAFVFPSLYEGFGLPVLEALACGAPVICSNSSCLPEVVGDAGLMIDPKNSSSITEAMKEIIKNSSLREQLIVKALKRASLFSWEKTAELTLKAYKEAVL